MSQKSLNDEELYRQKYRKLLHFEVNILNILNIFTEIIGMAPPINVQDWYGDRHTCQIASGALVRVFVCRLKRMLLQLTCSAAVARDRPHRCCVRHHRCPICFLPGEIYGCGGGLLEASIKAQRLFFTIFLTMLRYHDVCHHFNIAGTITTVVIKPPELTGTALGSCY